MATLGYSSLFSSGLLAPESDGHSPSRPYTPDPTTPRSRAISLEETTPTAPTQALPTTSSSNNILPSLSSQTAEVNEVSVNSSVAERPRMRRRRSSLGLSASPVAPLKSNAAGARVSASLHMQRQSLTMMGVASPSRSRAGSASETGVLISRAAISIGNNDATKTNSLMGRLRSGSVGNILRPRRLRKQATLPAPAPPPPTMPLPPLPSSCLQLPTLSLPAIPQTPRRPLSRRSQTADSIPLPLHTPIIPYSTEEARRSAAGMDSMDVDTYDYPSPLDSPGRVRGGYF